jgi:hypothetical protein
MRKPFTTAAVFLFSLLALLHVLRLLYGWEFMVVGVMIPMWASVLGAVVATLLAVMVFRESR